VVIQERSHPKVLFIVPRFHTNLIGWLQGLTSLGVTFKVLVQTYGKSEDHSICIPEKIDPNVDCFKITISSFRFFIQSGRLLKIIRYTKPELIIFRFEWNLTSIVLLMNIIFSRTSFVVYQQWPINEKRFSKRAIRFLISRILRVPLITPVLSLDTTWVCDSLQLNRTSAPYFVPFGMPLRKSVSQKVPLLPNINSIKFLSIGKFQNRKNHLETINLLMANSNFMESDATLEIIGEISTPEHHFVYNEIKNFIDLNALDEKIIIYINLEPSEALGKIKQCDVFLMMSDKEPASISNLESMSFGKPIIVKSGNGTANYIKHGKGGFIVSSADEFHKSLNFFYEHPEFAAMCGYFNLCFVKEFLDPETVARKILRIGGYTLTP
jgi:glycosyltransferase involved in cell wall biosynthesis